MFVGVAGAYLSEAPFKTGYLASLMFVSMPRAYLTEAPFRVGSWPYPSIIRLSWKGLLGTNSLAFYQLQMRKYHNIGTRVGILQTTYDFLAMDMFVVLPYPFQANLLWSRS
jgi:hypothetical protein